MTFIKRVLDELEFQDKTKSQLAESLGINSAVISMWIKRDSVPAADTALKVARFLNVPLEYLLTGEGSPHEEAPEVPQEEAKPIMRMEGADLSAEDARDIKRFALVYPLLSAPEKRIIMASLEAAAKSIEAASYESRAIS